MQKEIEALSHALTKAEKPYVAIVGGAKVSDKIELIENFLNLADHDPDRRRHGLHVSSRQEVSRPANLWSKPTRSTLRSELAARARSRRECRIELPVDHVVAPGLDSFGIAGDCRSTKRRRIAWDWISVRKPSAATPTIVAKAKTIVWNGPMGVFENPKFAQGTFAIARAVAESERFLNCRRRRLRGGRGPVRRGVEDHAHLDGRRRVAGIFVGAEASGSRSC